MIRKKRVFIICGEASGDLHAANLVHEWRKIDANTEFLAWGGDRLSAENVTVVKHIRELSFMGFVEVLKHIFQILRNFKECKRNISDFEPDALVLVDFPGFNLRMAEWAHQQGIRVIYYISPQLWAWKQGRIKKVQRFVDYMYCILPFERAFYAKFNYEARYFGHPLLDELAHFKSSNKNAIENSGKPYIAVLPGSRRQEVFRKLPVMLKAAFHFANFDIVVACSSQVPDECYTTYHQEGIRFVYGKTYEVLNGATLAIVTSGTATLETALFRVPQVVCYKSNPLSYVLAKKIVKVKYISLVNLILNEGVLKELIQDECNVENIITEMTLLLNDPARSGEVLRGYDRLHSLLGEAGASQKIAGSMIETFPQEL